MKSITDYLKKFENITLYSLYYYTKDGLLYPNLETCLDLPLLRDPTLAEMLLNSNGIVSDYCDSEVYYFVQHFTDESACIAGPFSQLALQKDMQQRYAVSHHLKDKFSEHIKKASPVQAEDTMDLLSDTLTLLGVESISSNNSAQSLFTLISNTPPPEQEEYKFQESILMNTDHALYHAPYQLEQSMLHALQAGDESSFYETLDKLSRYPSAPFAATSLKMLEYGAVALISVFTRAVIEAGVSPQDSYALSDFFLNEVSLMHSVKEYQDLTTRLCRRYFQLVKHQLYSKELSPYIRSSKTYILHHLNQPLSPEIIAKQFSIHKSYLLHLFTEHEGISLMEYVRKQRILAAQNMLRYSDFGIHKIANYYHFKTQSHFSAVFKKYTGMTPTQFRRQNKPVNFYH